MRRALPIAVLGLLALFTVLARDAGAATWSFTPPEGWTRDAKKSAALAHLLRAQTRAEVQPGLDVRFFVREGDPEVALYAAHWWLFNRDETLTAIEIANRELDRLDANEGTAYRIAARSVTPDGERAIGELVLEIPEERIHMRIAVVRDRGIDEVAFAACRGAPARLAACERALPSITIEPGSPPRPDSSSEVLAVASLIIVGLVALAGLLVGIGAWRRRVLARKRTPLVDNELVTLTGVVLAVGGTEVAPLSGKVCVMHRSRARVFDARGSLVEEPSRTVTRNFAIETPSGRVLLDEPPELDVVPSALVPRAEERELAFLRRAGYGADFHRHAGFDEIVVEPGATIVVRGMVRIERDIASTAERGYRDDAPTLVRLVSTPQAPVTISQIW